MKIAIVGDLHFGIKDSSFNAFTYQKRFFDEYLIPHVKEHNCDQIVFLGDLLHSRRNINLRILSEITNLFKNVKQELTNVKLLGIIGNHDLYFRNSYSVAAVKELDLGIDFGSDNKYYIIDKHLFIHWHNTAEELEETIQEIVDKGLDKDIEYIYGHFAFFGYKLNSFTANRNYLDARDSVLYSKFKSIKRVFSGHFHSPSTSNKVHYVGVPYQLTWAELNDELGFHILDTETNELTFIENKYKAFEAIKMRSLLSLDEAIENVEECNYRKLYKIYYNSESEAQAHYLHNQILLKEHDVMLIDEDVYNIGMDDEYEGDEGVSIEELIKTYFLQDANCIPDDEREGYYNIFKMVYEQVKTQSDSIEI